MRLKRALLRGRALFAVQIDSAYLHPVTATFEMSLQDGMRRQLPSSITVRATGTVSSEIVGVLEPGERPVSLVTRVQGDGLDLEIISNVDRGASPNWPLAVAGVAIPATSAVLAWYFASQAARSASQPRPAALPNPQGSGPAPLALTTPAPAASDFQAPVGHTMLPAVIDQTPQTPQAQTEPIRVGHDRVAPKRLRRIVEPAPVGGVLLTDATGAVLASAALTPSGKSLLRIPPSDRNRDLAVVLRATGSGGGAETRIPLRVEPGPRANTANAVAAPAPPIPGVNSTDIEMAVLTPRVVSGEPIRLHVPLPYDRLTISLLDPQRRVVSERQYAAAYDPVRIEAPAVSVPTTFELHASVEHGVAVNIGVYRVVVVPAAHAVAP